MTEFDYLEQIEMAAWMDFYSAATPASASACRLRVREIAGGVATIAAAADVLALNRVVGLGVDRPVTAADLDSLVAWYRDAGVRRFFVQPGPDAPDELTTWLAERGFRHHNNWIKLQRGSEPPPKASANVEVRRIDRTHASEFAAIVGDGFEWPQPIRAWVSELVDREGWHHYLAFADGAPAAVAAMYVGTRSAWFDFAATRSEYRGRGAQGALLERRIIDAVDLGAHHLVVETAEDTDERDAPSHRNAQRFGFEVAYVRPNYIYEFGDE